MSKGIYRVSGTSSNVNEILTQFRTDAWSTQLSRAKYTEYEVATALKRFFRDLPEPVMPKDEQEYFHQVSRRFHFTGDSRKICLSYRYSCQ